MIAHNLARADIRNHNNGNIDEELIADVTNSSSKTAPSQPDFWPLMIVEKQARRNKNLVPTKIDAKSGGDTKLSNEEKLICGFACA